MINPALSAPDGPLQVSQVTRYLRYVVESDEVLRQLSVQGEICEFSKSAAGHYYFTIKDDSSQIACVLFRREAQQQSDVLAALRRGVSVVVHGFLTLYEPRGTYQLYAERVVPCGDGASFQRFERLRAKLEAEGLFAAERKRPLPGYPNKLALVTSVGSQAYHDVLHRLRTQYPFVTVIEAGVSVQGPSAPDEMCLALDVVNRLTDAEVILLVRGGGAAEDLAAFNDERLARAVYASRAPVVTGVGHETDYTMVDFVADFRAATPSLAAAASVPDLAGMRDQIAGLHSDLRRAVEGRLTMDRQKWITVNRALLRASPQNRLLNASQRSDELRRLSRRAIVTHLRSDRSRAASLRAQLVALDPLAILARGYAVLTDVQTGRVVGRREDAVSGHQLRARVSDGEFSVRVDS